MIGPPNSKSQRGQILRPNGVPAYPPCAGWNCQNTVRRPKFFCSDCWAHVPPHIQEAVTIQIDIERDKKLVQGTNITLHLLAAASTASLQDRVEKDPELAKQYVVWMQKQAQAQAAAQQRVQVPEPSLILQP